MSESTGMGAGRLDGSFSDAESLIIAIEPEASAAERAAICAAYKLVWPDPEVPEPLPRWRYAGRSWRQRNRYAGWR